MLSVGKHFKYASGVWGRMRQQAGSHSLVHKLYEAVLFRSHDKVTQNL